MQAICLTRSRRCGRDRPTTAMTIAEGPVGIHVAGGDQFDDEKGVLIRSWSMNSIRSFPVISPPRPVLAFCDDREISLWDLSDGKSPASSLRIVQWATIRRLDQRGLPPMPHLWAAFTAGGIPRPSDGGPPEFRIWPSAD